MTLRKIETLVSPELHDVGLAVKKILELAEETSRDGYQGEDIATVAMGSFQALQVALKGAGSIKGQAQENPMASLRAVVTPVSEGVEAWLERPDEEAKPSA